MTAFNIDLITEQPDHIYVEVGHRFNLADDMILWDGCFYGDMEVFIAGTDDKA